MTSKVYKGYAEYEVNKRQYRDDVDYTSKYPEIVYPSHVVENIINQQHPSTIKVGGGNVKSDYVKLLDQLYSIISDIKSQKDKTSFVVPFVPNMQELINSLTISGSVLGIIRLFDTNFDLEPPKFEPVNRSDTKAVKELELNMVPYLTKIEEAMDNIYNRLKDDVSS